MKCVLCSPTLKNPYHQMLDAVRDELPLFDEAGIEHAFVREIECPYISHARATLLRKALNANADAVIFIDHDMSWRRGDLLKLAQTGEPVVAGMYRYKKDEEEYMGAVEFSPDGFLPLRRDGLVPGFRAPGGFLKITKEAVHFFMAKYPELIYGVRYNPTIDLFNHGVIDGIWYGEDFAFSKRWIEAGGKLWILADLELTHWDTGGKPYTGNLFECLKRDGGLEMIRASQGQREADLERRIATEWSAQDSAA